MIKAHGFAVVSLKVHEDDRGRLFEVVHDYEMPQGWKTTFSGIAPQPPFGSGSGTITTGQYPKFGQVYVVHNPARGAVRAFHKHHSLWDYFCIVKGSAKFCFIDDSENAIAKDKGSTPRPGDTFSCVISEGSPKLIVVPPGVFHGWMSLTDETLLLSVGSEIYVKENPDEVRVSPDFFNAYFGGNPWEVKGR